MKLRKFLIIILAVICTVAVSACLSSCIVGNSSSSPCTHEFSEWEDVENTCTEHTQRRVCKLCNKSETRNLPTTGHEFGAWEDVVYTCTEHIIKQVCSVCQYEIFDTAPPKQHSYGEWEDVVYTCTEHVKKAVCSVCQYEIFEPAPLKEHSYGEWEDVVFTCTKHTQKRTCNVCNKSQTQSLPTTGHKFGDWEDVVYTCTEHVQKRTCSVCQYEVTRNAALKEHNYGEWEYVSDGCLETGQKRTCSGCNAFETRTYEARGHVYVVFDEVSSCTVRTQEQRCSRCGDEITVTLRPHGHNYIGGKCEYCQTLFYDGDVSVLDKYNGTYGYEYFLSSNAAQAELYERIDAQARAFHLNPDINAENTGGNYVVAKIDYSDLGLKAEEAVAVWVAYKNDNPLYYWFSNSLAYTVESLNLIAVDEYAQGSVRAETNDFIYNKVTEFSNLTQFKDNAYRLALAFHDAIIGAIDYAYDANGKPETAAWAHSVMGVFTGRGGVCESYAKTFQLLLNYNGVENVLVAGKGSNAAHAWNLVKLDDGNWYWCDLTWDDTPNWEWGVSYYYFLVNDTQNVNWRDGGWVVDERNFLYNHTPNTTQGALTEFLYPLPERSAAPYSENNGLTLRKTFTVREMTYAVAGYNAVQLVRCETAGDVNIPETVTYNGVTYTVISIGGISEEGKFIEEFVFKYKTATSLTIPKTVKFIWGHGLAISDVNSYTVDENNEWFRSVEGVVFTKSMKTLVQYPSAASATEYRIPDGVVQVAKNAFALPDNLSKLYVGGDTKDFDVVCWGTYYDYSYNFVAGGLSNIANYLKKDNGCGIFFDEDNPKYTSDSNWVYNKDKTYAYCYFNDKATEIEIPATVTGMYERIFDDVLHLERITVAEGNTAYSSVDGVLYDKAVTEIICIPKSVEVYVLPDTVTQIGLMNAESIYEFFWFTRVREISVSNTLKVLGRGAFRGSYIEKINYGGTVDEWLAIEKDEKWFGSDSKFVIVCSNGTLDVNGNLI